MAQSRSLLAVTDELEIEVRFHSPDDPVPGPRGEAARRLAFPDGQFANQIEYAGQKWTFHHTELLTDDAGHQWEQLVYRKAPG